MNSLRRIKANFEEGARTRMFRCLKLSGSSSFGNLSKTEVGRLADV
jgi:hypothetical protein